MLMIEKQVKQESLIENFKSNFLRHAVYEMKTNTSIMKLIA